MSLAAKHVKALARESQQWQIWQTSHIYQAHTYIVELVPVESGEECELTHHHVCKETSTQQHSHTLSHTAYISKHTRQSDAYPFIIFARTHTMAIISKKDNDQRNRKHHCYQPLVPKYHPAECSDIQGAVDQCTPTNNHLFFYTKKSAERQKEHLQ